MEETLTVFQIDVKDNVATALTAVPTGAEAKILGERTRDTITAVTDIPLGHKIALCDISADQDIVKYGVVIGRATRAIPQGSWVHLHVMRSVYDERSGHLDAVTGAPRDTKYE